MPHHLPNPLQGPSVSHPAIYRPKYRQRVANPSHALDIGLPVQNELPNLIDSVNALEAWRTQDDDPHQVCWHPDKVKTLQVFISPSHRGDWNSILLRACRDWESASSGLIQFTTTMRPDTADIRIEWSDTPVYGREFEVGHTQRTVQKPRWITQATITLLREPKIDQTLTAEQIAQRLYTTMLHEFGHALGLEHSDNRRDVMHHRGWQNAQLSTQDIQRLQELYRNSQAIIAWF